MKKCMWAFVVILILCIAIISLALAAFTLEDVPVPSDETFQAFEGTQDNMHCTLLGMRFDLDDENMPVVIMKFTVENVGERSASPTLSFWIETTDSAKTSSGTLLSTVSKNHYDAYDQLDRKKYSELKPGESVTFEKAYMLDDFTHPIFINATWDMPTKRRTFYPQNINDIPHIITVH